MPRQRGDSQFYLITTMLNGMFRAECHKPDCHWWEDHNDPEEAHAAMLRHRKSHRRPKMKIRKPSHETEE